MSLQHLDPKDPKSKDQGLVLKALKEQLSDQLASSEKRRAWPDGEEAFDGGTALVTSLVKQIDAEFWEAHRNRILELNKRKTGQNPKSRSDFDVDRFHFTHFTEPLIKGLLKVIRPILANQ